MFLCIVEEVDINFDIDGNGHEVLMMNIKFSRGSKGSEIPAFPPDNFNGNEKIREDYFLEPIDTSADIEGTQTPQRRQISQEVLDILSREDSGPGRGANKPFTGEVKESLIELIKNEPLTEQYHMFVREKIIEDTPANFEKYVTNKEAFPQDNYQQIITMIDRLKADGSLNVDDLDPKLKALYLAAQDGDDFYFEPQ
jgi:hypothetical protein